MSVEELFLVTLEVFLAQIQASESCAAYTCNDKSDFSEMFTA